jgi:hypothetical protein
MLINDEVFLFYVCGFAERVSGIFHRSIFGWFKNWGVF